MITLIKLEEYFNSIELPTGNFTLSSCEEITDVKSFVDSHIQTLKANPKNKTLMPYYLRLVRLKNKIEDGS